MQKAILLLTTYLLIGCSSPSPYNINDISTEESYKLCANAGYYAQKNDIDKYYKLAKEIELRIKTNAVTEDECLSIAKMGAIEAQKQQSEPSSFESVINTINMIGTAGHTN